MHEIRGRLYDGRTSRSREAVLRVYRDATVILVSEGEQRSLALADLAIATRLGDTPRRVGLGDGLLFETEDNAGVDAVQALQGGKRRGWLHWLETHLAVVVVAAAVLLALGAAFAVVGVPRLAREAAFALPPEWNARVGEGALEVLDRRLLPSELEEGERARLASLFGPVAAEAAAGEHRFELVFRGGGPLGANAFALPSGSVVVTDELVALAEREEELTAVLAHEVGHVVERHGLRQVIQSSLLAIAVLFVTGDLSSSSSFVAALPVLVTELSYSRRFEREADDYALAHLQRRGIPPTHFAAMLQRLEDAAGRGGPPLPFLSTHPATPERIRRLRSGEAPERGAGTE